MKKKLRRDLHNLMTDPGSGREPITSPKPKCRITIEMERDTLVILSNNVTIETNTDFVEATSWRSPVSSYIPGRRTFIIKGSLL